MTITCIGQRFNIALAITHCDQRSPSDVPLNIHRFQRAVFKGGHFRITDDKGLPAGHVVAQSNFGPHHLVDGDTVMRL